MPLVESSKRIVVEREGKPHSEKVQKQIIGREKRVKGKKFLFRL